MRRTLRFAQSTLRLFYKFCADLSLFARYLKRMAPMKQILETQLELQLATDSQPTTLVELSEVPQAYMRPTMTHVTQEMEIGITGGVEDGVDNSGAAKVAP